MREPSPGESFHTCRYSQNDYAGIRRKIATVGAYDSSLKTFNVYDTYDFVYRIFYDEPANEWKEELTRDKSSYPAIRQRADR